MRLWKWICEVFQDELSYLWSEITCRTGWVNYFWMLFLFSLLVALGELLFPWRKKQPFFRKQFWLDCLYMYVNFFIFKLLFFTFVTTGSTMLLNSMWDHPLRSYALFDLKGLPLGVQLLLFFVVLDFVQWLVHVALHRFDFLWMFHQVHHSVEQMSFPAHLRFHWVEHLLYTPVKYLTVTLLFGVEPEAVFLTYYLATLIGHLNHANIRLSYGPLRFLVNNPLMHIWHHARKLPREKRFGINFGISLSLWDYLFRTNYIPAEGRDIALGFPHVEEFPQGFIAQECYPLFFRGKK